MRNRRIVKCLGVMIGVCVSFAAWARPAAAAIVNGTSGADTIIVGMIKRSGDAAAKAYICVDNGTTGAWTLAGDSSGLTTFYLVHGNGGNDNIFVVGNKAVTGPANCQETGQNWTELLYNGWYVDLYGDASDDQLSDGGSAHDTLMFGLDGADRLFQSSTIGAADGGLGGDSVFGYAAGATDYLYGGDGVYSDCVSVSDASYNFVGCGPGTDFTTLTPSGDCEFHASSC